jgi:HSP20 family molecular chaperone IbpA
MSDMLEQIKHLLQSGDQLFMQFNELWKQNPKVDVHEQGNKVKVLIEAPGLDRNRHQWAFRVTDQQLCIRGQLDVQETATSDWGSTFSHRNSQQFTRIIPLPVPVHRKPSSVHYSDGLVTIVLEKQQGFDDDGWRALEFTNRSKRHGRY